MIKSTLALSSLLFLSCFQLNSCVRKSEKEMVEMGGPSHYTSLVLFYRKDVSKEQIREFQDNVLSKPSPYGPNTGLDLPNGVAGDFRIIKNGFEGVGINFSTDASQEQRDTLQKRIRESPVVYKVFENVIPNEITDL